MSHSFSNSRRDYKHSILSIELLDENPLEQINVWVNEAVNLEVYDPTAMSLATVSAEGKPSCRIVLLKEVIDDGLCFFTNYNSRKGRQLEENYNAALLFFWPSLERQIRVEGVVEKLSEQKSTDYFYSRPIGSQISASVSNQSEKINSLEEIKKRFVELNKGDERIDKPQHWGGYKLVPSLVEFWQGGEHRIHNRFQFELIDGEWQISLLAP